VSTKQYKKTRIYTVLKILKVTSLYRYTDFISNFKYKHLYKEINKVYKSVNLTT